MEDPEDEAEGEGGSVSSSPSDDDDEEEEEGDEEELQELRRKIEEALKVNGAEADADGSDDATDDEDLMDDDQMMAIDEQLAEVFRSQVNSQKTSKGSCHLLRAQLFRNLTDPIQTSTRSEKLRISRTESLISLIFSSRNSQRANIQSG